MQHVNPIPGAKPTARSGSRRGISLLETLQCYPVDWKRKEDRMPSSLQAEFSWILNSLTQTSPPWQQMSLVKYVICACRLVSPRSHADVYSLLFPSLLWKDAVSASLGIPMRRLQSWGLAVACVGWWALGRYKCPRCRGGHLCAWLPVYRSGHCWHRVSAPSESPAVTAVSPQGLLGERFLASSWADIPAFGLGLVLFLANRLLLAPLTSLRLQHRWCPQHPAFPAWPCSSLFSSS